MRINPMSDSPTTALLTYLVNDFNKPVETKRCLESIRRCSDFPHEIILLSNGGDQSYIWSLYEAGLIDRLIVNKRNTGCGYGAELLFDACDTEYAVYFQNDQEMAVKLGCENVNQMIGLLKTNAEVGAISWFGYNCGFNVFNERAFLINRDFYRKIPKTHGGPGPFKHLKYNEQACQEWFKEKGYRFVAVQPQIVRDTGKYTIQETPCGGLFKQRTDTKAVAWIKLPKQKYVYPPLTDKEWEDTLAGKWVDWTIPEHYIVRGEVFTCWQGGDEK